MTFRKTLMMAVAAASLCLPSLALADPIGTYNVTGTNLDSGNTYQGTITIDRLNGVYKVKWVIGKDIYKGIGLGGKLVGSDLTVGPASPEDNVVSVGYATDGNPGMGMFLEQQDGSWQGVWTFAGSTKSHPEKWVRAD